MEKQIIGMYVVIDTEYYWHMHPILDLSCSVYGLEIVENEMAHYDNEI
jgi:hypothetical protein